MQRIEPISTLREMFHERENLYKNMASIVEAATDECPRDWELWLPQTRSIIRTAHVTHQGCSRKLMRLHSSLVDYRNLKA